jgi:hypothetical protein
LRPSGIQREREQNGLIADRLVSARRYRKGVTENRRMTGARSLGSLELTGVRGTDRPTAGTRSKRVFVVIGYFVLLTTVLLAVLS